jgi:hypothetical protein
VPTQSSNLRKRFLSNILGGNEEGMIKNNLPDISPYPYQPLRITEEDFREISGKTSGLAYYIIMV